MTTSSRKPTRRSAPRTSPKAAGAAGAARKGQRAGGHRAAEEDHRTLPDPGDARRNRGGVRERAACFSSAPPIWSRSVRSSGISAPSRKADTRRRSRWFARSSLPRRRSPARFLRSMSASPSTASLTTRCMSTAASPARSSSIRRLQPNGDRQGDRLEAEANRVHHPQQQDRTRICGREAKAAQRCRAFDRYAHQVRRHRRSLPALRDRPDETGSATTTCRSLRISTSRANRPSTRSTWARCSRPATMPRFKANHGSTNRRACRERAELTIAACDAGCRTEKRVEIAWSVRMRISPASRSRCCSSAACSLPVSGSSSRSFRQSSGP